MKTFQSEDLKKSIKALEYSKIKQVTKAQPGLYIVFFLGLIPALFQYLFNRSLWLDEASLALNIIDRSFLELFQPLDHHQVAPIGFLLVTKVLISLFGNSEFTLRFIPLISFVISIPLIFRFTSKLSQNQLIAILATALFALNPKLLNFSSEFKQYMVDVLFFLIITNTAYELNMDNKKGIWQLSIIGAISIWFSHISLIVIPCILLYLVLFRNGLKQLKHSLPLLVCGFSFIIYYFLFIHNHPSKAYMISYWHNDFLPANPFQLEFWAFLSDTSEQIFTKLLRVPGLAIALGLFTLVGIADCIIKGNRATLFLLLSPILTHLFLSALQLYPFAPRLTLYLLPIIFILASLGIVNSLQLIRVNFVINAIVLITPIVLSLIASTKRFPVQKQEIKKALTILNERMEKNDELIYHFASENALEYYLKSGYSNLKSKPIRLGPYLRNRSQFKNIINNRENRFWLMFTHVRKGSKQEMLQNIRASNFELEDEFRFPGCSLYLFQKVDAY